MKMISINAAGMDFISLNSILRETKEKKAVINNCEGQRYIGCAASGMDITVNGTPGNALGSYLNGGRITVHGNAQDAVGDTMNGGEIIIHGSASDGIGLSQRGGEIYVRDSAGYRAGVHMKQYRDKTTVLVIGGSAGSFLGEYLAGGYIIVLGLTGDHCPISNFCAAGMHGGKIFVRGVLPPSLPRQVIAAEANAEDMSAVQPYIDKYCRYFGKDKDDILSKPFHMLTPDSKNPYKMLYVFN